MNGVLLNVVVESLEEAEVNHEMGLRPIPDTNRESCFAEAKIIVAPVSIQSAVIRL